MLIHPTHSTIQMGNSLTVLSPAKLEREMARRSARHDASLRKVIAFGWGNWRLSDIRRHAEEGAATAESRALAERHLAVCQSFQEICDEVAYRRTGQTFR